MARTSYARRIRPLFCVIAALAALLLPPMITGGSIAGAQGAAAGEQPKYGGIIRLAEREPPNLDPHLSISFNPQNIGSLIYSSLVRFPYGHEQKSPYDLTIMPDLAERWEYLDDKTVVFYLRKGVKFHNKPPVNGRELKAQDVKYSLERFAAKSGFRARFDDVDRVEVVDDYTVKIVTKHPFAPLLAQLASPSHNMILPKEAEDQYGDFNKAEAAIGTGPFILDRYERGVKLLFKRNPDFYIKGLPYVDGIEWQMTPEASARVSLLRAGKVDFVHTTGLLSGEEAIPLQRTNPELKYLQVSEPQPGDVLHAHRSAPLQRHPGAARPLPGDQSAGLDGCPRIRRGVLRHRAGAVCAARLAAGSKGDRPGQGQISGWGSTARRPNACWLRPAIPRVLIPRCFIIRAIRSPGPHASSWRWMN